MLKVDASTFEFCRSISFTLSQRGPVDNLHKPSIFFNAGKNPISVGFPVCSYLQTPAFYQYPLNLADKFLLNEPSFMVPFLWPGVGE